VPIPNQVGGQTHLCGYGIYCVAIGTHSVDGGWMCDACYQRYVRLCTKMKRDLQTQAKTSVAITLHSNRSEEYAQAVSEKLTTSDSR
jgi:hypothetical protein